MDEEKKIEELSADDKLAKVKDLFQEYELVLTEEKRLDDEIQAVKAQKSEIVKQICDLLGKGPFEWKGEELVVTKRNELWYFRSKSRTATLKIA